MVRMGVEVGLDGFNATHNYESFCHCQYCCEYVRSYLPTRFGEEPLQSLFGNADLP